MNKPVYILSASRTPLGSFGGSLAPLSAIELGTHAIKSSLKEAQLTPDVIEEVFFGNVCSANLGQAPARQSALGAGISVHAPSTTINKVCASGLKATILAAQSLQLGDRSLVISGGTESMSNIPFYSPNARWGSKFGHQQLVDGLQFDGLTDPFEKTSMGVLAEKVAQQQGISREDQDAYCIQSYKRSKMAWEKGYFKSEVHPIELKSRKGSIWIDRDEEFERVDFDRISSLRPAFDPNGTITAANASTMNDGAAALVLSNDTTRPPIAKILAYSETSLEPSQFTLAPIRATEQLLEKTTLSLNDIDLFEVNEAFSMVPLAFSKLLGVSLDRINIHGGAVSLGHPLGCSGARILVTLIHGLRLRKSKYGIAAICNGGGGASAVLIEAL